MEWLEEFTGTAYRVKCKEKRDFTGEVSVNAKGTRMAKGKCPVWGPRSRAFWQGLNKDGEGRRVPPGALFPSAPGVEPDR